MIIVINPDRIRKIISDCTTEADIQATLRAHKIRFSWTTANGETAFRIPCRKGAVVITRNQSRPATVMTSPAYYYPPIYHS